MPERPGSSSFDYDPLRDKAVQHSRGRKSKLNEDLIERITQMVKAGNYIETACAACGINQSSYYNWLRNGQAVIDKWSDDAETWPDVEDGGPTLHDVHCYLFLHEVKKAQAEAEAFAVTTVRAAMGEHWQAAMTFLERKYPGRWKRRDEVTAVQGTINMPQAGIDEAELLKDPTAVKLMHEALELAQRGQLPATTGEVVDAEVVEDTDG